MDSNECKQDLILFGFQTDFFFLFPGTVLILLSYYTQGAKYGKRSRGMYM